MQSGFLLRGDVSVWGPVRLSEGTASKQNQKCVCVTPGGGTLSSVRPQADAAKGRSALPSQKNQTRNINTPTASRRNTILASSDTNPSSRLTDVFHNA